jgi:hypothetical protein
MASGCRGNALGTSNIGGVVASTTKKGTALRQREQILASLERVYREAFSAAEERQDEAAMEELDIQFQRDQIRLEVLLDIRELLLPPSQEEPAGAKVSGILDTAQKIKNLTRLR